MGLARLQVPEHILINDGLRMSIQMERKISKADQVTLNMKLFEGRGKSWAVMRSEIPLTSEKPS
jgi:hypothetical protein